MSDYLFKTKRLGFKYLEKEDLDYLMLLDSDSDVRQFFPDGVATKEQISKRFNELMSYHKKLGLPVFVLFDVETSEFVGRAGFTPIHSGEIEVVYAFHKRYWGQGLATETLAALLKWAKKNIKSDYIIAYTVSEHIASQRVMEKCGMKFYKKDAV
ncbi:MAG: GNAT family N-acetyltransferase, partial [Gammaproteobacteria bacterium]